MNLIEFCKGIQLGEEASRIMGFEPWYLQIENASLHPSNLFPGTQNRPMSVYRVRVEMSLK